MPAAYPRWKPFCPMVSTHQGMAAPQEERGDPSGLKLQSSSALLESAKAHAASTFSQFRAGEASPAPVPALQPAWSPWCLGLINGLGLINDSPSSMCPPCRSPQMVESPLGLFRPLYQETAHLNSYFPLLAWEARVYFGSDNISLHSMACPLDLMVSYNSRYSMILCQLDAWFLHSCT